MMKLRKGPVCRGSLSDGSPCEARVARPGERCHVCLERLATSDDVECRRRLAGDAGLPAAVFELLGADADHAVRLAVAQRPDCPLVVLQELEHDEHPQVRAAAAAGLSTAFTPRVLQEPEAGNLFTRAELDALGQHDAGPTDDPFGPVLDRSRLAHGDALAAGPGHQPPRPSRRTRRAGPGDDGLFAGIEEILGRLDALSTRLSSLEHVLASTGERLGAIGDRLDGLGVRPVAVPAPATAPLAPVGSLLPVVHPAELSSGPVIRTDIVAAAWLAVLPLLARRRDRGQRRPAVPVASQAVPGPFTHAAAGAAAELLPGARSPTASDAGSPGRREGRLGRRRHTMRASSRDSRR
jgi:hypothetical protein